MKRLKNVEGKNKEQLEVIKYQGEKQLKLLESNASSANAKEFQILKLLNRLNTDAKIWFDKTQEIDKKLIIKSLSVCIQTE